MLADGFTENPYDVCVFNKIDKHGDQITVLVHVDDLFITCINESSLDEFDRYLLSVYPETKTKTGKVLDYVGMTFDFSIDGEVSVTMANIVKDILSECGVTKERATPAAEHLFQVRDDAPKATVAESQYFHSFVARMLYLAKRVRPECLTAVSFLSTRVNCCDADDMAKLARLLGYLKKTPDRGITLRIGERLGVNAYIDAAYGVHTTSGKSHTGCAIVLGESGPVYSKSSKQKIVTKSSTEAELDQDNLSCMALVKRGGPCSERSRHISIRHFWVTDRVKRGELGVAHKGTADMFANVLTKPVQGAQFIKERRDLTNWRGDRVSGQV